MKKITHIPKVFILFLMASLLFWLLITLSKEYTTQLTFYVSYKNLPKNKLLQKQVPQKIDILVKGSGFKLLLANFNTKDIQLNAKNPLKNLASKYYLSLKNQQAEIQKQLLSGLQIQQIIQDFIYLNLIRLETKKIPVIPNFDIKYQLGYTLYKKIKIEPDSIVISGSKLQIKQVKELFLEKLKLRKVNQSFSKQVKIHIPKKLKTINFSHYSVFIKGTVDKFTQGEFEIPFKIKKIPVGFQIKTFRKKVKIIYKIGLQNFNKVTKKSFTVICDFSQSQKNNLNYLIPKISHKPSIVDSVKIVPSKIEYLIDK